MYVIRAKAYLYYNSYAVFAQPQGRYTDILKVSSRTRMLQNNRSFSKRSESIKYQKERAEQQVFVKQPAERKEHRLGVGQQPQATKGKN